MWRAGNRTGQSRPQSRHWNNCSVDYIRNVPRPRDSLHAIVFCSLSAQEPVLLVRLEPGRSLRPRLWRNPSIVFNRGGQTGQEYFRICSITVKPCLWVDKKSNSCSLFANTNRIEEMEQEHCLKNNSRLLMGYNPISGEKIWIRLSGLTYLTSPI